MTCICTVDIQTRIIVNEWKLKHRSHVPDLLGLMQQLKLLVVEKVAKKCSLIMRTILLRETSIYIYARDFDVCTVGHGV